MKLFNKMKRYKKLNPSETTLVGEWYLADGRMQEDEICKRIKYLISSNLVKKATSDGGWSILYQDKSDKRYWELSYPQSEMHGGGPPTLMNISEKEAKAKYDF